MSVWHGLKRTSEIITLLSIAISLPIGIFQFVKEDQKETQLILEKSFDDLDIRYVEYLKLALNYPGLDVFDSPDPNPRTLSKTEKVQQKMLYSVVIALLERAYLTFQFRDLPSRNHQWEGWNQYADNFACRAAFREAGAEVGNEFDIRFQLYMNQKMETLPVLPQNTEGPPAQDGKKDSRNPVEFAPES